MSTRIAPADRSLNPNEHVPDNEEEHMSDERPLPTSGEKIRLLHCEDCKTIDELPDFDGPPEFDDVLEALLRRHETPSGLRHVGKLFDVDVLVWQNEEARRGIIKQIKGGGSAGLAEFDATFYDTRNTFFDDAMKCYAQHLRPKGACPDWMSDSKILLPDTKARAEGRGSRRPEQGTGTEGQVVPILPSAEVLREARPGCGRSHMRGVRGAIRQGAVGDAVRCQGRAAG
jgi:hypothetical protein